MSIEYVVELLNQSIDLLCSFQFSCPACRSQGSLHLLALVVCGDCNTGSHRLERTICADFTVREHVKVSIGVGTRTRSYCTWGRHSQRTMCDMTERRRDLRMRDGVCNVYVVAFAISRHVWIVLCPIVCVCSCQIHSDSVAGVSRQKTCADVNLKFKFYITPLVSLTTRAWYACALVDELPAHAPRGQTCLIAHFRSKAAVVCASHRCV